MPGIGLPELMRSTMWANDEGYDGSAVCEPEVDSEAAGLASCDSAACPDFASTWCEAVAVFGIDVDSATFFLDANHTL
jgi:hypothetical protein